MPKCFSKFSPTTYYVKLTDIVVVPLSIFANFICGNGNLSLNFLIFHTCMFNFSYMYVTRLMEIDTVTVLKQSAFILLKIILYYDN